MSKITRCLSLALALPAAAALALLWGGCSSNNSAIPMGCVTTAPDAGTAGATCGIDWSCNSDTEHFQILCTAAGNNWSCLCTSDTSGGDKTIIVNKFPCQSQPAAAQCGWTLQM